MHEVATVDISSIGGMTRSRRCYASLITKKSPPKPIEEIPKQKESEVVPNVIKGQVTEKEA